MWTNARVICGWHNMDSLRKKDEIKKVEERDASEGQEALSSEVILNEISFKIVVFSNNLLFMCIFD
ncbi:hypothetical protein REPUB_Repub07fG0158000 [Reevesia pubescens]